MKITILLLIITFSAFPDGVAAQGPDQSRTLHPSTEGVTGATLFATLIEHNLSRERDLHNFSVYRTYIVKTDKNRPRAESEVRVTYQAPNKKQFSIISEKGSGLVRQRVFQALLENEVQAAAGASNRDSSITPANYTFDLIGEEDVDGLHTFVVHAIPKRNDKYLFEGKVWIEASEFAIVRIEGHPSKSLSFWVRKVDFVRRYQKIDGFWLPLRDETVTDVRLIGRNIFTIDHSSYEINGTKTYRTGNAQAAMSLR